MALLARCKYDFLDGTITAPTPPCTKDDWLTIHYMLVSWIMNTIDPEVKSLFSNYENAYLLCKDLNERFSVVNGPQIQQLKSDIARCEQSKTMPVAMYFGKLKVLWDELNNYEPLLSCLCGKCECNLGKFHEKRREDERLHQFLMGLCYEYYDQIRSTLLSHDPLQSLNRAFQQISQEERVRCITRVNDERPEVVGFAIHADGRGKGRPDKIDKSGYPEWWTEKFGNKKEGQTNITARQEKTGTSLSSPTVGRGRGGVRAHNVAADVASISREATVLPGFTFKQ